MKLGIHASALVVVQCLLVAVSCGGDVSPDATPAVPLEPPRGISVSFSEWTQENRTQEEINEITETLIQPAIAANLPVPDSATVSIDYWETGWMRGDGSASGVIWRLTYVVLDAAGLESQRSEYEGRVEAEAIQVVYREGDEAHVSFGVGPTIGLVTTDIAQKLAASPPFAAR